MKLPKIPAKGSQQWKVALALAMNANDSFLKHVWVLTMADLTHHQVANAVSKLRDRDWPIEDEWCPECEWSGYRLDKERWAMIRVEMNAALGIIPTQ